MTHGSPARIPPPAVGANVGSYIREYDGLRGLLSLWVFAFHIATISDLWKRLPARLAGLLDGGQAVNIFIILSGFVIATVLMESRDGWGAFIMRRFLRLWPVFAVCLMLALAFQALDLMPVRGRPVWQHVVVHATMLHSAVPDWLLAGSPGAILNPAWSISLEWQFYLLAPLVIRPGRKTHSTLILVSAAAFVLYRIMAPQAGEQGFHLGFLPFSAHLFWLGIVSAIAYRELRSRLVGPAAWPAAVCFAVAAGVVVFMPLLPNVGVVLWLVLLGALFAVRFDPSAGVARRISGALMSPVVQRAGVLSYPIYLSHEIWIWAIRSGLESVGMSGIPLAFGILVVALPLVWMTSSLLHRFVEKPCIDFGRSRFGAGGGRLRIASPTPYDAR